MLEEAVLLYKKVAWMDQSKKVQEAKSAVTSLAGKLKSHFSRFEIEVGGSVGHESFSSESIDADLIIRSFDITVEEVLKVKKDGYRLWLEPVKEFLKNQDDVDEIKVTEYSVKFKVKNLVYVNVFVCPYWDDKSQLYEFLKSIDQSYHDRFIASAAKWQVEFLRKIPPQVKELISKAKTWRDQQWPLDQDGSGRPSSYLISILVNEAYRRNNHNVTQEFKKLVKEGSKIDLTNGEYDDPELLPALPRVVDPGNTANNVWKTGFMSYKKGEVPSDYEPGDGDCTVLLSKIDTFNLNLEGKIALDKMIRERARLTGYSSTKTERAIMMLDSSNKSFKGVNRQYRCYIHVVVLYLSEYLSCCHDHLCQCHHYATDFS